MTNPHNMNSRSILVNDNLPSIQLNNTIGKNGLSQLVEDSTTLTQKAIQLQLQRDFEKKIVTRSKFNINDIIIKDNIIITLKKPTGFNDAIKEVVNRKGYFKLVDEKNRTLWSTSNILSNLYNKSIKSYFFKNLSNKLTGRQNSNHIILKNGSNIPIDIIDDTFKILPSYTLDNFIIEIPIIVNKNILKNVLKKSEKREMSSTTTVDYNLNFGIFFDVEILDKFPVNFL